MVRCWVATSLIAFLMIGCDLPVDGLADPSRGAPVKDASSASTDARQPDAGTTDSDELADTGDEAADPGGDQNGGHGGQGERGHGH
jgi:hypothetical protein